MKPCLFCFTQIYLLLVYLKKQPNKYIELNEIIKITKPTKEKEHTPEFGLRKVKNHS
jgi:hypothetical protein